MDLLPGMDGTDLVILAIVLADPDSALLLTTDRALLSNAKIREYEAGMRRDGLRNVRLRIKDRL